MNFYGEGPIFLAVIQQYLRIIIRQWFRVTREKTTITSSRFQKKLRIKSSRFQYEKRNEKSYRHIFSDFRWFSVIFSNKKRRIASSTVRRSVSSRFFQKKATDFRSLVVESCLSRTFRFCRCRDDGEKNRHLDAEIEVARATLAGMLLLPSLFLSFCSVCGVDEVHPSHLIERRDGATYIAASTAVDGRPNQRF